MRVSSCSVSGFIGGVVEMVMKRSISVNLSGWF